jgi:excisionase family DNA binding protein
MIDETPEVDGWLTLAEAAEKLSVSIDTVRRRLHRGELIAKEEITRFGKAWRVKLEDVPSPQHSATQGVPTPEQVVPSGEQNGVHSPGQGVDAQGMLELVQLIKELQLKAETAAMWQARAMVLEEQLGYTRLQLSHAHETIKALEAPKAEVAKQREGPSGVDQKPWWRFW